MATTATHVWRPSCARIAALDDFVPVPRGSAAAPPPLVWPAKDPADVLDYQLDVSAALVGNAGDVIQTLDVMIQPSAPGDLALNSATADGAAAVFWLSAGQVGVTYVVTVLVTTANGRTIQRDVLLPVLALSQPAAPPDALTDGSGSPLTDQSGNPVLVD